MACVLGEWTVGTHDTLAANSSNQRIRKRLGIVDTAINPMVSWSLSRGAIWERPGIGADGVVFIDDSTSADVRMIYLNADVPGGARGNATSAPAGSREWRRRFRELP